MKCIYILFGIFSRFNCSQNQRQYGSNVGSIVEKFENLAKNNAEESKKELNFKDRVRNNGINEPEYHCSHHNISEDSSKEEGSNPVPDINSEDIRFNSDSEVSASIPFEYISMNGSFIPLLSRPLGQSQTEDDKETVVNDETEDDEETVVDEKPEVDEEPELKNETKVEGDIKVNEEPEVDEETEVEEETEVDEETEVNEETEVEEEPEVNEKPKVNEEIAKVDFN